MIELEQINVPKKNETQVSEFERAINDSVDKAEKYFKLFDYRDQATIVNNILKKHVSNFIPVEKGNPNLRISGKIENCDNVILFQYCFGNNTLNSYRRLLGEIAIYANEKKIDYKKLTPIIIFDVIPNKRSLFWNTLKDIDKVLKIKFKLMTVLSLYIAKKSNISFKQLLCLSNYDVIRNGNSEKEFLSNNHVKSNYNTSFEKYAIMKPLK